ncbi:MAG: hypothetical protein ACAI44_36985 [Candidatus Sericytochromatia bacterium]
MGDLIGKVGTNYRRIDQDVNISKVSPKSYASKEEALAAARKQTGSELVFEKEGKWHVGTLVEKGWMISGNEYQLSNADAATIELDQGKLASKGAASAQISFIEEDDSHAYLKLADDPSSAVRSQLAQRTDLPPDVYVKLAGDYNYRVQSLLARNPAVPTEALRVLAANGSHLAQKIVALNPEARHDTQIRNSLASSMYSDVRQLMVMPDAEIRSLSNQFQDYFSGTYDRFSALFDMAHSSDYVVRREMSQRADLPSPVYMELAYDSDYQVRRNLSVNPYTSVEALRILANDSDYQVRRNLAQHPMAHFDPYIMNRMANDSDYQVQRNFAQGPVFKLPYQYAPLTVVVDPFSPAAIVTGGSVQAQTQTGGVHVGDNINVSGNNNTVIIQKPGK